MTWQRRVVVGGICLARCFPAVSFVTSTPLRCSSSSSSKTCTSMAVRAEDVLASPEWPEEWPFTKDDFRRQDETRDIQFYESPRLVTHIDDSAIAALTKFYAANFKDGDDVLDICSSWISHFPPASSWKQPGRRVGLGMNAYELKNNKQIDSWDVRDLNVDPTLPYEDNSFDFVTCVVSIDYLNKPVEVLKDVGRVLRPGGKVILSMSNRCFPTKAIKIWLRTGDLDHIFIVGAFLHYSGAFKPAVAHDISPNPGRSDPMYIVEAVVDK